MWQANEASGNLPAWRRTEAWLGALVLLGGCAAGPPKTGSGEPIGAQLPRVAPELGQQRFLAKLSFEAPGDAVFVAAEPRPGKLEGKQVHTGAGSYVAPAGTQRIVFRLPALLGGVGLSQQWTLAGAYLRVREATAVAIRYEVKGRTLAERRLRLEANQWVLASVDLTDVEATEGTRPAGNLLLDFPQPTGAAVWLDDLVLIDNAQVLVGGQGKWTVERRGYSYRIVQPDRFELTLPTPEASEMGWVAREANACRARFAGSDGKSTSTIYADGRSYINGQYRPLVNSESEGRELAAAHAVPAAIEVDEEFGRVDRTSPGDANNDGYNETRGAYQVVAAGPRFEVTLIPRTPVLIRPMIEIARLPAGEILATMEGQLIERVWRIDSATVLVELPGRIDRPVTVNLRVGK